MKNVILKKLANKINTAKDTDIVAFALVAAGILFYVGWELGRAAARM